jgi:hypothetical protein
MSENVQENEQDNYNSDSADEQPEPLLKSNSPIFKPGRPRKSDDEKAQTRRAMLDRRNERNKARVQVDKVIRQNGSNNGPMIADFTHTKNNRVDGVINPKLDPLFDDKLEMEKKLLHKKFIIEDKKLDLYLNQLSASSQPEKKKRAPPKPKEPKPQEPKEPKQPRQSKEKPQPIVIPKQKTASDITDEIFNMYR